MFSRIPFEKVNWLISSFLIGTLFLAVTAAPVYLWFFGLDTFQVVLFFVMFFATGFSITIGYHRLFSHRTFEAHWIVRLFTLLFGAAAFENSVLLWACEHRSHHKHVDHDDDPYCISKGLFHAHIGWLLFKLDPPPPFDNVADLKKDPLVMWQHRHIHWIAAVVAFVLPSIVGFLWGGWVSALGAFLIGGVARIVVLQHCTFCINSLCHYLGDRPYSSKCSARDSWLMAIVTLGEGYHNFHHEFQYDYRNGVKPWQFDPTKWAIWTLSKLGLAGKLRRVPEQKIILAELAEAHRRLETSLAGGGLTETAAATLGAARTRLEAIEKQWIEKKREQFEWTREKLIMLRNETRATIRTLHQLGLGESEGA
ncbi:MAG: acyl-CoA desaturase [Verrucomicrobia bacterium]|nr:acyl-CoA desaturase [Verrucomicrobiota bacterium]